MKALIKEQRFIPFRKTDIITMCCGDGVLSPQKIKAFKSVCNLLSSIFHFQFHTTLESLKDCYAPINPDTDTDTDTKLVYPTSEAEKNQLETTLVTELTQLLNAANFKEINKDKLTSALETESIFKIRLNVNFDDFKQVLFFRRGESIKEETLVSWFGLRQKTIQFVNYGRVVMYIKFKDQAYFDGQKRKNLLFSPGTTIIKLFRNIPSADIEMLFPNSEVQMKTIDKLIIGVPATIGGIFMLATKLGTTLILIVALLSFWLGISEKPINLDKNSLLMLAVGFGTLFGFLWKQFNQFKNRKIRFMKTLSDNLYFKSLDNNTGVFHRLIDAAEEEENKETILAYYFLLCAGKALTEKELDESIENWFETQHQTTIDFEVDDAIRKLVKLDLVKTHNNTYMAIPLDQAQKKLSTTWNNYFKLNTTSS